MAYTAFSVVYGEQPSAAKWNTIGTNMAGFNDGTLIAGLYKNLLTVDSNPYKFSAYRNGALTLGTGAQKITYETELFDTNSNYDAVTNNRYVAPVTGFYFFTAAAQFTTGSTYYYDIHLYKNGSSNTQGSSSSVQTTANNVASTVTGFLSLTAADYVEVYATTNNPGGQAVVVGANFNHFAGFLVCRT